MFWLLICFLLEKMFALAGEILFLWEKMKSLLISTKFTLVCRLSAENKAGQQRKIKRPLLPPEAYSEEDSCGPETKRARTSFTNWKEVKCDFTSWRGAVLPFVKKGRMSILLNRQDISPCNNMWCLEAAVSASCQKCCGVHFCSWAQLFFGYFTKEVFFTRHWSDCGTQTNFLLPQVWQWD